MPAAVDLIETMVVPRSTDLGGFRVNRALPTARRAQWWGRSSSLTGWDRRGLRPAMPWTFARIRISGCRRVTYLMDGEIHRDSWAPKW